MKKLSEPRITPKDKYTPFQTKNEAYRYLAGFIDGEGCLTISKQNRGGHHISPEYKIKCIVNHTNLDILKVYKNIFGGEIYIVKLKEGRNHKKQHQWIISNKVAYDFCKKIIKYLILKKKNAQLLIDFYEKRISNKYPIKTEELERREKILQEIRVLNKRGIR